MGVVRGCSGRGQSEGYSTPGSGAWSENIVGVVGGCIGRGQ